MRDDVTGLAEADSAAIAGVVGIEAELNIAGIGHHHAAAAANRLQQNAVRALARGLDNACIADRNTAGIAGSIILTAERDRHANRAKDAGFATAGTNRLREQRYRIGSGRYHTAVEQAADIGAGGQCAATAAQRHVNLGVRGFLTREDDASRTTAAANGLQDRAWSHGPRRDQLTGMDPADRAAIFIDAIGTTQAQVNQTQQGPDRGINRHIGAATAATNGLHDHARRMDASGQDIADMVVGQAIAVIIRSTQTTEAYLAVHRAQLVFSGQLAIKALRRRFDNRHAERQQNRGNTPAATD